MTARARSRARKGDGDLLADQILDAAEALLVERGSVEAVSIREVARRVGVTSPAIYLHFADKEDLFYQCCRRGFANLASRMEAVRGEGSSLDQLRRLGRAYVEFGLKKGSQYRVIFGGVPPHPAHSDDPGDLPGVRAFEILLETVGSGIAAGEFRDDLDPVALAVAVWSAVHGAVLILLSKDATHDAVPIPDSAAVVDAVLGVVGSGVRS
ncbi:MAG: hypothetical protein A2Z12_05230 [Actinobacteria bacterium RBG_16_68_21]|nr:MAG: hypothetical protein A2Z12_05230 [Actinobacteria bacterium RBG_16_68_21]